MENAYFFKLKNTIDHLSDEIYKLTEDNKQLQARVDRLSKNLNNLTDSVVIKEDYIKDDIKIRRRIANLEISI